MNTPASGPKKPTISARLANGERKEAMKEIDEEIKKFGRKVRDEFEKLCSSSRES